MTNEKHKRVLYAEASDIVQQSHGAGLARLNCRVVPVASAQEAYQELSSEEPFDLILLGDLAKLTDDDYLQTQLSVVKKARSLDPTVPILLFTSLNCLNEAYETRPTAQMLKPAGVNDLIAFVAPYLFAIN
jgi:CheY-like chemotaxis protein